MAGKSNRQALLKSACRLVEKKGFMGLTARGLAKEAGISTQPIYLVFGNMTELKASVRDYLFSMIQIKYFKKNTSLPIFLENYRQFVRDSPDLFMALFFERSEIRMYAEAFLQKQLEESLHLEDGNESLETDIKLKLFLAKVTGVQIVLIETSQRNNQANIFEELWEEMIEEDLEILLQDSQKKREKRLMN